jgi:large subunit ribosomal protein L13e
MVKHNNVLPNVHLRKHTQRFFKTWFNQPARKHRRQITRKEKATRTFPRPLEKLRPLVHCSTRKYSSKIRYGRGFTLQEIKNAGLTTQFAQTIGIAVDHRRQDMSEETLQVNTQRLAAYKSKLILFPRKAGKPKKGLVADATADRLK